MSLAEDIQAEQLLYVPSPSRDRRRGLVLPVARVTTLAPNGAVCRVESTDATQCGWVEPDSPNGLPPDVVAWLETAQVSASGSPRHSSPGRCSSSPQASPARARSSSGAYRTDACPPNSATEIASNVPGRTGPTGA